MRLDRERCRRWLRRCFSSSRLLAGSPTVGVTSALRPYQASVIERAVALYGQGTRRLLVPLATGLGKTVVFTHLPQAFPELCRKGTLVLVHRDELVQQAVASFRKFLPHLTVGVEKGPEVANAGLDVVVASVQTLGRRGSGAARLRKYADYGGVVVVDEAHHVKAGGMYDDVLNGLGVGSACRGDTRAARLLAGFTATPRRADGLSLRPFFDHSIGGLDLQWGIANGYLVDIHAYAVRTATDIAMVPTRMQDFAGRALSTAVNNDVRNEAAARAMLEFGAGGFSPSGRKKPRGIAFCADVRHAHDLARVLNEHDITAMAVDGGMNKTERSRALSAFRSGEVSTLTNCGVLTEGFDAPFCDTIVMCRPTQSAPLYMQMIGRGTRPWIPPPSPQGSSTDVSTVTGRRTSIAGSPKPRMHVIDLVDNCGKHKVMSMSTALGLSPDFGGDDGGYGAVGEAFSVEHVGSLAADALSLVDADGAAEMGDGCSHPLLEAKTPRELALMVKHYRLLQGAKTAETLLTVTGTEGRNGTPSNCGWDASQLSVGDRIGKDSFLRVIVEGIATRCEEEEEEDDEGHEDEGYDEDLDQEFDFDDDEIDGPQNRKRGFSSLRHRNRRKTLPRRKGKRFPVAAATVHMRHPGSGTRFSWRTAGVKDTSGAELHEGASYRLVATVKEEAQASVSAAKTGAVGVTRCRLTLVTAGHGTSVGIGRQSPADRR